MSIADDSELKEKLNLDDLTIQIDEGQFAVNDNSSSPFLYAHERASIGLKKKMHNKQSPEEMDSFLEHEY